MLLLATTSLGIGFGLTVPALNTFAAAFFPAAADRAVLYLNALLGLGTALAPVLVAVFVGLGFWSGLPLLVAVLLAGAARCSACALPLEVGTTDRRVGRAEERRALPPRFWVFAGFAALLRHRRDDERQLGDDLHDPDLGASTTARLARADRVLGRWSRSGRILFAAIERRFPERGPTACCRSWPPSRSRRSRCCRRDPAAAGVLAFGLAGLGCSALLPLTISFGQRELTAHRRRRWRGCSSPSTRWATGSPRSGSGRSRTPPGSAWPRIYGATAVVAVVMGVLAFVVVPAASRAHRRDARRPTTQPASGIRANSQ